MSIDSDPVSIGGKPIFSPDKPEDGSKGPIDKETLQKASEAYDSAERPFTMKVEPGKVTVEEKVTPSGDKE